MAQHPIRLEIIKLPEYHAAGSDIFAAGSFNGWNPADTNFRFKRSKAGVYSLNLSLPDTSYEFKLTRGDWDKVECLSGGTGMNNRSLNTNKHQTLELSVEEWADRFPSHPRASTASPQVQIIDTAFLIPQLKRTRRVWIYLPIGYATSKKKYPVIYMHDGQNVFDDATSYSGEWGVDEFMDSTKLPQSIIVAIDHGGNKRLNEYNPYNNKKFGRGEGNAYVDFLVKTLKPFIDKNYRTLTDQANTSIAGSSMGGLISLYACLKYPAIFGHAGVFSPAFWITDKKIFADIKKNGKATTSTFYLYGGKLEGETMVPDMIQAAALLRVGHKGNVEMKVDPEGKHNEATWRKEFPLFYEWMVGAAAR